MKPARDVFRRHAAILDAMLLPSLFREAAYGAAHLLFPRLCEGCREALLRQVGIDPQRRAETLSVEEFVSLATALR